VHVFVGMRGSGKSTGMKAVLYELRKYFDNGILMSATEEVGILCSQQDPPADGCVPPCVDRR